ncbi:hypothetical protein [Fusobacterium sp. PH5-44]|uniref:hypothetical protein n=1 Tax=unclassified Fusobacterium TaxID=2648384 RepID=UPI003D24D500
MYLLIHLENQTFLIILNSSRHPEEEVIYTLDEENNILIFYSFAEKYKYEAEKEENNMMKDEEKALDRLDNRYIFLISMRSLMMRMRNY